LLQARVNTTAGRIQKKDVEEIEKGFHNSLDMAKKQGAISLQLRTSTSLARFLKDLGRAEEGKNVLTVVYDSFTEGHDTGDLKNARQTLDELT
jgi:predicted ATPase